MKTMDLIEAATFLGLHPNTLQARAKAGEIPGAKPGKRWVFLEEDLVAFLRSQYPANRPPVQIRLVDAPRPSGSRKTDYGWESELERLLGRPIKSRRK